MIVIDGIVYQEKQNLDEDLPPCSMCHVPLNKCSQQCKRFGKNYFLTSTGQQDMGKEVTGCVIVLAILGGICLCALIVLCSI